MGWEDRPYYRDRAPSTGGPLMWLLNGSVPLGTWFGIRVRAHASFVIVAILSVLFPQSFVGLWYGSITFLAVLFGIVLLHEFGHCLASRSVGGDPRDILMTPLGGLAFADAPRRPWATFWTVLGGPLVNVLLCMIAAAILAFMGGGSGALYALPWNPFRIGGENLMKFVTLLHHSQFAWWTWYVFSISYALLLFNLWPIFPLDGGQLLQSLLWVKLGYYKSMRFACITGMIGAVVMAAIGLASREMLFLFIAISGFMTCFQQKRALAEMGPEQVEDETDYSASLYGGGTAVKRRRGNRWAARRARRLAEQDADERVRIDAILAKVSAQGMHSLTWGERRALKKATEHQRQRDLELARLRKGGRSA